MNGFAFKSTLYANNGIPVVRISDIKSGKVDVNDSVRVPMKEEYQAFLIEHEDVLIAMSGATTGKFGVFKGVKTALQNQRVGNIRPKSLDVLNKRFMFYFLYSAKKEIERLAYGGAQPNISASKIEELCFKLPPLNEQKRIVAKIEELFSELDNGIESLKKAKEQLKLYRQAVLKQAFEGKLTEKWREENTAKIYDAEELSEKIKVDREKYYQEQLQIWKYSVTQWEEKDRRGKKPSKPKIFKNFDIDKQEIVNSIYFNELTPWVYEKIGNVVSQLSIKKMPNDCPEAPFIGMDCISRNGIKPTFSYTFNELRSAGNAFFKGNILYGRLRSYLNKTYLAEYNGVASGEFIIMDTIKTVNSKFLHLILHANHFVDWAAKQASGDKPRVKYEQIAQYIFGIPSLSEQQKIVSLIETQFSVIDQLESDINTNLKKSETLRQSILKKAFSGQLVPQDPNDEPASVLLEKIKAEKAKLKSSKKRKKGAPV